VVRVIPNSNEFGRLDRLRREGFLPSMRHEILCSTRSSNQRLAVEPNFQPMVIWNERPLPLVGRFERIICVLEDSWPFTRSAGGMTNKRHTGQSFQKTFEKTN